MKRIDWVVIIVLCLLSVFALKDLFRSQYFTSHDGIHQVARLYYFDQAIRDGQFPPRWAGGLLNNFGYPLFIFSYQMPWYIAEPLHLLGFSIFDSIKLTFLLGFILSGITMYLFQKSIFDRFTAWCGSILYLFAPNRFLAIFVRGAIGDATVFIFPPLLFWSLIKIKDSKKIAWGWVILGALSIYGILLSHALVFLFFFICYSGVALYFLIFAKYRKTYLISIVSTYAFSFGISAYYFIPSLVERSMTNFTAIMQPIFLGTSSLTLKDLLYTPWGYGLLDAAVGRMSFQLGIAQWVVIILSVIFCLLAISGRKKFLTTFHQQLMTICLVFSLIAVGLTQPISTPFWKFFSKLFLIDYTWRSLAVVTFLIPIMAGIVVQRVKLKYLLGMALILLALYANRNHLRINKPLDWPIGLYIQSEFSTNTYDEYIPQWVWPTYVHQYHAKVDFSNSHYSLNIQKSTSNLTQFTINVGETGSAVLNTIYYPGWQLYVDGKNIHIQPNKIGVMEFTLHPGTHRVVAALSETQERLLADMISLATLGGMVGYFFVKSHEK